jgi:hypothetical protein
MSIQTHPQVDAIVQSTTDINFERGYSDEKGKQKMAAECLAVA